MNIQLVLWFNPFGNRPYIGRLRRARGKFLCGSAQKAGVGHQLCAGNAQYRGGKEHRLVRDGALADGHDLPGVRGRIGGPGAYGNLAGGRAPAGVARVGGDGDER